MASHILLFLVYKTSNQIYYMRMNGWAFGQKLLFGVYLSMKDRYL